MVYSILQLRNIYLLDFDVVANSHNYLKRLSKYIALFQLHICGRLDFLQIQQQNCVIYRFNSEADEIPADFIKPEIFFKNVKILKDFF